jgi:hypothetical protein
MIIVYVSAGQQLLKFPEPSVPELGTHVTLHTAGEDPRRYQVIGVDRQHHIRSREYYGLMDAGNLHVIVTLEPCT